MYANEIRLTKNVVTKILSLSPSLQQTITRQLNTLTYPPFPGVKLLGPLKGYKKLAIGDYRLVYRADLGNNQINILALENQPGKYT